ncbi:10214_t:CDS:2, partial [Rhizophagus irregularis]
HVCPFFTINCPPASSPLIITLASNLILDEKRDLFFDVNRALEIPMEVFNEEWWLLVLNIWMKWDLYEYVNGDIWKTFACHFMKHRESTSSNVVQVERYKNSPNYTHSLSEINRLKWPKAIRSLVEIEAAKNYLASTITSAIKEYAMLELDLGIVFAHPEQLKKLERHRWLMLINSTHKTNCNIEVKSIKKIFSGMTAGEQECQVLLCIVHVMRT